MLNSVINFLVENKRRLKEEFVCVKEGEGKEFGSMSSAVNMHRCHFMQDCIQKKWLGGTK